MNRNTLLIAASVMLAVLLTIGISYAANPASTVTTTGQTLTISIDSPPDGSMVNVPPGTVDVTGTVSLTQLSANVVYVIDASGSTQAGGALIGEGGQDCNGNGVPGDAGDDFNGNGWVGDRLDCEISGVIALNQSLSGNPGIIGSIVMFSTGATIADMSPEPGDQPTTSPLEADKDGNGIVDIEEVARSIRVEQPARQSVVGKFTRKEFSSSGTNFNAALQGISNAFAGIPGDKVAYFLSDGEPEPPDAFSTGPGTPLADVAAAGIVVNTYSVGVAGAGCAADSPLRIIADQTGGTCVDVPDPTDLRDVLVGGTAIRDVRVRLNDGAPIPATLDPFGNIRSWSLTPLTGLQCGENLIRATASTEDNTEVTADITVIGQCEADLVIFKDSTPETVDAEGEITYTVTVENRGPVDAMDVTVVDTLPAGTTLVSASGSGWECTSDANEVTCTRPSIPVGVRRSITIVVTAPAQGGDIVNTASVTSSTPDSNTDDNTTTVTTTVNPVADLSITMTAAPDPVPGGGEVTYAVTVDNNGPSDAEDVVVTVNLPPGTTFVSAAGDGWSCSEAGGVVTCTRPNIPSGGQSSFEVVVTAPRPDEETVLSNDASVSAATRDPNMDNNSAAAAVTILVPPKGTDKLTARVYIDYACDSFFQYGLDIPLANVPVTVTFANGATETLMTLPTGWVYFSGFDVQTGVEVHADIPAAFNGYALGMCIDSPDTIQLGPGDFDGIAIQHKHVEFRTQVVGETVSR